ncbi:MAG: hypothetical protein M3M85_01355 [bacterium]|nr:hypothetical protein [bacterium]
MKNNQGFAIPLIIAIIAVLGIGGGAYVYVNKGGTKSEDKEIKLENKSQTSADKEIYYTSQPYGSIRANVANMQVWASIYFDKYKTYVGVCDSSYERTKAEGIDKFLDSTLKIVSAQDITCRSSEKAYVYSLRMPDGNSWCADNSTLGAVTNTVPKALSCKYLEINSNDKVLPPIDNHLPAITKPVVFPAVDQQQEIQEDLQNIANIVASVANFRALAEVVFDSNGGSYLPLCSGRLINVAANSSLPILVKTIITAQDATSQSGAGIVCIATKYKYVLEVKFKKYVPPSEAYLSGKKSYCVDSTGVAGDNTRYKIDQTSYSCKEV